jgi:hypothetical protein
MAEVTISENDIMHVPAEPDLADSLPSISCCMECIALISNSNPISGARCERTITNLFEAVGECGMCALVYRELKRQVEYRMKIATRSKEEESHVYIHCWQQYNVRSAKILTANLVLAPGLRHLVPEEIRSLPTSVSLDIVTRSCG